MSKSNQSSTLAQFLDFTNATPSDATRILKAYKWNINQALEAFYLDPVAQRNAERQNALQSASLGPALNTLFDKYALSSDNKGDKDNWSIDATLTWCTDLSVDPTDAAMLGVAELSKAQEMGSFERKTWVAGWQAARCADIAAQRKHIDHLRSELSANVAYFRRIYSFAFDYAREIKSQRSLALETAEGMWDLLLPLAPPALFEAESCWNFGADESQAAVWLDRWKAFLQADYGGKQRPVSKDVWLQFLDFAAQTDKDFEAHDPENDAWPSLIDAFVEHEKKKPTNANGMDED